MNIRSTAFALAFAGFALASSAALAVDGEITKVDDAQGKITIKHGPITNLDMPAMTMVFKAGDPAMIKQVKAGDKVKFDVDKVNGQLTVTKIEKAK